MKQDPETKEDGSELWCAADQEGGDQVTSWSKVASAPGFSALRCEGEEGSKGVGCGLVP